jgi:hypothetical protein
VAQESEHRANYRDDLGGIATRRLGLLLRDHARVVRDVVAQLTMVVEPLEEVAVVVVDLLDRQSSVARARGGTVVANRSKFVLC